MVIKQLNDMEKQNEDDNKSNFTIELDLEKQVDSLLSDDEDDDLNDAKYLENDKSNWGSTSNLLNSNLFSSNFNNNQTLHNLTTPIPLSNNILNNKKYQTIENEEKINNNNMLTPANSITDINKKILGDKNKKKEKELNISILGDKCTDTFTGDSNIINNETGNAIQNVKGGEAFLGLKNKNGEKENIINMTNSNTSSFDFHSNSVDFNNIDLIKGMYYSQTPNNSIYYNSKYFKNNKRYNKFQDNYSQSKYLRDYYSNRNQSNKNYIYSAKTFNNMDNNINYSELSSRASVQSLNNNNNYNYNKYNTINNYYQNNMGIKMKDEQNKSYNENLKLKLKDQKWSKFIQKKIDEKSSDFLYKFYEQIKNNLFDIMVDQYGNYVIQKFVDNCDKKLISKMLEKLSQNVNNKTLYEISINNYGTRPLQKMLENLSSNMTQEDINIILNLTKGKVQNLIKDINGNRVIQCIILNIKNKEVLTPIYKEMCENLTEIIKTKSGCCVFSKVLLNIIEDDLTNMVDIIIRNINQFINDEFGNISLKRIIKLNNEIYNNKIFNCIKDNIIHLSCQKYSSNVIEACIDNTTSLKKKTIEKLIENENNIHVLILDQFGNYIIQNALQNAEQKEFDIIIEHIKENEKKLRQSQYGKIIIEKLMKNYKNYLIENKISKNNPKNNNNIKNKKQKHHNNDIKNRNKFNDNKKNKK